MLPCGKKRVLAGVLKSWGPATNVSFADLYKAIMFDKKNVYNSDDPPPKRQ